MSSTVQYPQGNVLLRNLTKALPVITRGEGLYFFDASGKKYIDAAGGALVASVGHGNKEIAQAVGQQLSQIAYINGTQFTSEPTEKLASYLAEKAHVLGLDKVSFLSSGSEATEAAIKFARQLWVERGQDKRGKIIARTPSYHGNTLFALSASGRPHYKKYYGPLLSEVLTVSSAYEYRYPGKYDESAADVLVKEFEALVQKTGPENICAFIVEPIIGSSSGAALPPPGYFEKIQVICRKHDILIIADEVMVGCGRTGKFFASEWVGLKPDILTLGKGINGGYAALSAVLVKKAHVDEMKTGSGYFMHAQTYMQAPCMTGAGWAVAQLMEKQKLVENSRTMGDYLLSQLREHILSHPHVGWVSGKGLFAGVEFVEDKKSKKPYARSKKVVEAVVSKSLENGMTLWPNVGHVDGVNGDLVMLGPPLNTTRAQVDEIITTLQKILKEMSW